MQVDNRYSLWKTIKWQKKYIILFLLCDSIPIAIYHQFHFDWMLLPWQPISLIGIAVAFYLGFKNNSSYERLWEARKIWGGIVNNARSFTVGVRDFVAANDSGLSEGALNEQRKVIVHRHVAWLKALTYQLRKIQQWENNSSADKKFRKAFDTEYSETNFKELAPYLSKEDLAYAMSKGNRASHIISLQSKHIAKLREQNLIDTFKHVELQGHITDMYTLQGQSERIKNFPFPRQYATTNFFFVMLFLALLPFSMLSVFDSIDIPYNTWLAIPFAALVSWVFYTMELVGEYSENPFEGLYNDVPISSLARTIEIDIREMIDETDLPEPLAPVSEFNIQL